MIPTPPTRQLFHVPRTPYEARSFCENGFVDEVVRLPSSFCVDGERFIQEHELNGVLFTAAPWHPIWEELVPDLNLIRGPSVSISDSSKGHIVTSHLALRIEVRRTVGVSLVVNRETLPEELGIWLLSAAQANVPPVVVAGIILPEEHGKAILAMRGPRQ